MTTPSMTTLGGKKSRRNGSILYQLLTQGLKRPVRDTQSIERIIKGADSLQSFLEKHGETALQFENVAIDTLGSENQVQWKHMCSRS